MKHSNWERSKDASSPKPAMRAKLRPLPLVALAAGLVVVSLGGISLVGTSAGPSSAANPPQCCSDPSTSSTTSQEISSSSNDTQIPTTDPPDSIDGAKNPELIPDEVAYRVLMIAVAEPEEATKEQKARADAKMHAAGLSDADLDLFLSTANQFVSQIDANADQAAKVRGTIAFVHPDSIEGRQLSELGRQQDQILVNTIGGLRTNLTMAGAEKLHAHPQNLKRKMVIYPPPPNMPAF